MTGADLAAFEDMDRRFQYIADAGLVHANAQLFFTGELGVHAASYSDAYLAKLSRYWVARYTGTLRGLQNVPYTKQWYNPRTGVYSAPATVSVSGGQHAVGAKPDGNDWVLLFTKQ